MYREEKIKVSKTARIIFAGCSPEKASRVIICLHGYAQKAEDMLPAILEAVSADTCIIAPEGLNHFYAKGFTGNPVSCWMTSIMREDEILDYTAYLNKVYNMIKKQVHPTTPFFGLGFSQGATTLSRWLLTEIPKLNTAFFCSGLPAEEWYENEKKEATNLHFVYGLNDPFIRAEQSEKIISRLRAHHVNIHPFQGEHFLDTSTLKKLFHAG